MGHVYRVEFSKTCLRTKNLFQKKRNGLLKYVLREVTNACIVDRCHRGSRDGVGRISTSIPRGKADVNRHRRFHHCPRVSNNASSEALRGSLKLDCRLTCAYGRVHGLDVMGKCHHHETSAITSDLGPAQGIRSKSSVNGCRKRSCRCIGTS